MPEKTTFDLAAGSLDLSLRTITTNNPCLLEEHSELEPTCTSHSFEFGEESKHVKNERDMLPHLAVESLPTLVVGALSVCELARSLALHVQHLCLAFLGLEQLLNLLPVDSVPTHGLEPATFYHLRNNHGVLVGRLSHLPNVDFS